MQPLFTLAYIDTLLLEFRYSNFRTTDFVSEDDRKWIEFLQKANQHNWDNINAHVSSGS